MTSFRVRRRSTPIIAILVVTALLAGVLAHGAWEADRSHRADAARVIRDYADFAAWEFSVAAKEDIFETLAWVFGPVRRELPLMNGSDPPSPSILSHEDTKPVLCHDRAPYFFRLDFPERRLVVTGRAPSPVAQRWIRDKIAADLSNYSKDLTYSSLAGTIDGKPGVIVYQVKHDGNGNPAAAYGLPVCVKSLAEPSFALAMKSHKLLPPSLTKSLPNDSLISVIVHDDAGRELWRTSQQYATEVHGVAKLPYVGGFTMQVALNRRYADDLLIGGLPRSRVPILIGILAVTIGLAVTGVVQLRREDQLARIRGDFIASVSHELRTPLAQLRMFAETLLLGRVRSEDERQRSLEIVDQEARRLSHLVENILQFSRAERQTIKLAPTHIHLAAQVSAAIEAFEPIAKAREVSVVTSLDESMRGVVDTGALRQIMLNLLDNAVKYGPRGQEVRVFLQPSPDRQHARIVLEDQGPGVPKDKRETIWEPFYRLDRDANSAVAGSGIGLNVVRDLARRHGGSASIEDSPSGARFVVELPLGSAPGVA